MTFMERVTPVVDETIRALAKVKFVEDPIAGARYSRATSIVSSAYKRHGRILLGPSLRPQVEEASGSAWASICKAPRGGLFPSDAEASASLRQAGAASDQIRRPHAVIQQDRRP
jgi:hypothetical protein